MQDQANGKKSVAELLLASIQKDARRGQRVGVVLGGQSSERAISLRTGQGFVDALTRLGYEPQVYDMPADLAKLVADRPDALLIGLHGGAGENGVMQGFLETLGVAYTGSGVLASALAMDKGHAKAVLNHAGVPTPSGLRLVGFGDFDFEAINADLDALDLELPLVVKPNDEGSSVGVYLCREETDFAVALDTLWDREVGEGTPAILVEQFLNGPEYTVGFFNDICLGSIEVTPEDGFYDYHAKYESGQTLYQGVEDEGLKIRLETLGRDAYKALGCRGVARVDIKAHRPSGSGDSTDPQNSDALQLFVLEINTIPGMTATSLIPKLAASHGIEFDDFTELMLASACRESS